MLLWLPKSLKYVFSPCVVLLIPFFEQIFGAIFKAKLLSTGKDCNRVTLK